MGTELRKKILINGAISMIREHQSDEFGILLKDERKKSELYEKITEQIEQMSEVVNKVREFDIKNWDAFNHLPDAEERKRKIKSSLEMKTFKMTLNESTNEVEVTRDGKVLEVLQASSKETENRQVASILVESIILVLELCGIPVPDTNTEVQKGITAALSALKNNTTLNEDVNKLLEAYQNDDKFDMVKCIFYLVLDTYEEGALWDIIEALVTDMTWYEWIIASAKIAAFIAMLVTTGGIAEIAQLVAILVDATFFIGKLANLETFRKLAA